MIRLKEKELNYIISSVVKKLITEEMHVINEKLFLLALFIYEEINNKIRNGENTIEFVISKEEVSKYYPYHNPQPLKVVCGLGVTNGKMEYKDKTIVINIEFFYPEGKDRCISRIAHELTHFVNDNEGGGIPIVYRTSNEIYEKLSYYLRSTECNARCSEFGFLLRKEAYIKPIKEYESITRLNRIGTVLLQADTIFSHNIIKKFQIKFEKYKRKIFKIYSAFQNP